MPSLHEVALLIAFTSPALALMAINVVLALRGETETLLIPIPRPFASIVLAEEPIAEVASETALEYEPEPLRKAA